MRKALKKEWLYGIRNHRFLIVGIGLVLLGALTPLMMAYLLPELLGQQMMNLTPEEISEIFDVSQRGIVGTFLADLTEIGLLLICLVYSPLIPSEINEKTIPFTRVLGVSITRMVISKWVIFSLITMIIGASAIHIDYLYAGLIDHFDIPYTIILQSTFAWCLWITWIIALLIWVGTWMKRHVATAMIVFFGTILLYGLLNLFDLSQYTPWGLISIIRHFDTITWDVWMLSSITSGLTIGLMLVDSVKRLHHLEWIRSIRGV